MKTLKTHTRSLVAISFFFLAFSPGCVKFYRMPSEQQLGSNLVSIRPYCNSSASRSLSQAQKDGPDKIISYEFTCDETKVEIRGNLLTVNAKSYGTLNEGDHVTVDYGKVRVNSQVREEVR